MSDSYLPPLCGISRCTQNISASPSLVQKGGTVTANISLTGTPLDELCNVSAICCSWADTGCTINGIAVTAQSTQACNPPVCPCNVINPYYYQVPASLLVGDSINLTATFVINDEAYGTFDPDDPYPSGCYVGIGNNNEQGWSSYAPFNVCPTCPKAGTDQPIE